MPLFSKMATLVDEYLPVFILSIIAGFSGIIKKREYTKIKILEVLTSNGLLGVITLILLNDFTDFSIESKYAIVCLASYIGIDDALDLVLKIKGLRRWCIF